MEWIPEEQVAEDGSVRKAVAKQGQSVLSFFCVFWRCGFGIFPDSEKGIDFARKMQYTTIRTEEK
jgi:hypothetical protein